MDTVMAELVAWGESQADVRALILTSTRAISNTAIDEFSDYDIIVITSDIHERYTNRHWQYEFGNVVIDWWDPLTSDAETCLQSASGVVYYPGTRKIDFTLWPIEMATNFSTRLSTELDAGYRILLDKDGIAANWPSPSGVGYAVSLPNCEQYRAAVNDFFIGVPYVVTALLRGELLQAKWVLDYDMRYVYLLPMLEWYAAALHGEPVRLGVNGKGLQKLLPEDIWERMEHTYAGLNLAQNRQALNTMILLFRDVAQHVGLAIACEYPDDLHQRVLAHIDALEAI